MSCITKCILAVVSLFMIVSASGLELVFESKNLSQDPNPVYTGTMYVDGDKVRMQLYGEQNRAYMIFRGDKDLIWVVDHHKKEYTEINKATIDQMGQTINTAMQQMMEQMDQLTPEQQKMMKEAMGNFAIPAKEPQRFKSVGTKKQISGYPCTLYEVYRGDEKIREMWITSWGNIKNSKDIATAFTTMSTFFKRLMESFHNDMLSKIFDNPYTVLDQVDGFPVMNTEFENAKPVLETVFKKIDTKEYASDLFMPPKDFSKKKIPFPN